MPPTVNVGLALWLALDAFRCARSAVAPRIDLEQAASAVVLLALACHVLRRPRAKVSDHGVVAVALVALAVLAPCAYDMLAVDRGGLAARAARSAGLLTFSWSALSLKDSFAVLPATRDVCTCGPYSFVRHPMYASYLLFDASFWLDDPRWSVFVLWCVEAAVLFARCILEERCLASSAEYAAYLRLVRHRWIPGVA